MTFQHFQRIPIFSLEAFLVSGEDVFIIYGHGSHLINGLTICINFQSPFNKRLHMKFEENWPRGFRGEVVQRCGRMMDDGQMMTAQVS